MLATDALNFTLSSQSNIKLLLDAQSSRRCLAREEMRMKWLSRFYDDDDMNKWKWNWHDGCFLRMKLKAQVDVDEWDIDNWNFEWWSAHSNMRIHSSSKSVKVRWQNKLSYLIIGTYTLLVLFISHLFWNLYFI